MFIVRKITSCVRRLEDSMSLYDLVHVWSELSGQMTCLPRNDITKAYKLFVNLQFRAALEGSWYALEKLAEPAVTLTDEILLDNIKLGESSLTAQEASFISNRIARAVEDEEEDLLSVLKSAIRKVKSAPNSPAQAPIRGRAASLGGFLSDSDN